MKTIMEEFENVKCETEKLERLLDYQDRGLLTKEELERLSEEE